MGWLFRSGLTLLVSLGVSHNLRAGDPAPPSRPGPRLGKGYEMDYGPALGYTINCRQPGSPEPDNLVPKGVAVRLSGGANVCFDTEHLRYAAGWTDGFLDISRTHLNSSKGSDFAWIDGAVQFSSIPADGWRTGSFSSSKSHYHGFYRSGLNVTFAYAIDGVQVRDHPSASRDGELTLFERNLAIAPHSNTISVLVCSVNSALKTGSAANHFHIDDPLLSGVFQTADPGGIRFEMGFSNTVFLTLAPATKRTLVRVTLAKGTLAPVSVLDKNMVDPENFCRAGPSLWPESLQTAGRPGSGEAAYVVDTLVVPERNPWHSWLRFTAFDFFSDGRAAIATWNGDVWIVSGIDDSLKKLRWKRFAAGLFEALGLKIVNDTVYVTSRDRIVRLRDLNGDDEADFYESFNADAPAGPSYHAFAFDLQTDSAGNFYYIRCGQRVDPDLPLQGGMLKISADGAKTERIAHGLRAANGMAIGPHDEIVCSDNQGNWTPSSRINWINPGGFYGFVPHAHAPGPPTDYEKPLCWLPMTIDNSSGGQAWVTSSRWGPFENYLLHTSYGKAALFLVMTQKFNGVIQGGVVQFPLKFESGIMRARFHPLDGQLYLCGLQGWQTVGLRDGCFQRVRYTGKPVLMPSRLVAAKNSLELGFTCRLDLSSASDPQNYAVEAWNYRWTEAYGSPDYSIQNPNIQRHDQWSVTKAQVLPDGKTVRLDVPQILPAMQVRTEFRIRAENGTLLKSTIYSTINALP